MERLDPLIEGYLSYLADVGRKVPRTVIDVRCTLRRATADLEVIRPGVPLWKRPGVSGAAEQKTGLRTGVGGVSQGS